MQTMISSCGIRFALTADSDAPAAIVFHRIISYDIHFFDIGSIDLSVLQLYRRKAIIYGVSVYPDLQFQNPEEKNERGYRRYA